MNTRVLVITPPQLAVFLLAIIVFEPMALAMLPARDEDILCGSTHVVVGTVLKATRSDPAHVDAFCGYKPWNCSSGYTSSCQSDPHMITTLIKVSNVLGATTNKTVEPSPFYTQAELKKVSVGDTMEVVIGLFNNVCRPGIEDHQGWFSVNPPEKGASPAESVSPTLLRRLYVGKEFVFSLKAIQLIGLVQNAPEIYNNPPGTFWSDIWRMERLPWVKSTLLKANGVSCPKPISSQPKTFP